MGFKQNVVDGLGLGVDMKSLTIVAISRHHALVHIAIGLREAPW